MKIILNKLFLIILFILNVSCKSGGNITDPPPINNSECIDGQSKGCDNICSTTPLENDACGVCGGEITILSECCESDVCISIQNVDLINNILEVWMLNNKPVAGFQLNISGVTIISASEGSTQSNGMTQSNSEHVILGFSLSGNSIPSGNSILTHIGFSEYNGSICLSDPVFSNNSGAALSVELGDCFN